MKMQVRTDENGYIAASSAATFGRETLMAEYPEDFRYEYQDCYMIRDGIAVLDEDKLAERHRQDEEAAALREAQRAADAAERQVRYSQEVAAMLTEAQRGVLEKAGLL